jgi:hypothetical protein
LYITFIAWVSNEKQRIEAEITDPEQRQNELRELLGKETKLLQTIDRLKIKASNEQRQEKVLNKVKQVRRSSIEDPIGDCIADSISDGPIESTPHVVLQIQFTCYPYYFVLTILDVIF